MSVDNVQPPTGPYYRSSPQAFAVTVAGKLTGIVASLVDHLPNSREFEFFCKSPCRAMYSRKMDVIGLLVLTGSMAMRAFKIRTILCVTFPLLFASRVVLPFALSEESRSDCEERLCKIISDSLNCTTTFEKNKSRIAFLAYACGLADSRAYNANLQRVVECGHLEMLRFLCSLGAPMSQDVLIHAINTNQTEVISMLVNEFQMDINQPMNAGMTPLMYAMWSRNTTAVQRLIELNPDLNKTDCQERTVLHYAIDHENETLLEQLMSKMQPDATVKSALLHYAVNNTGSPEMVRVLVNEYKAEHTDSLEKLVYDAGWRERLKQSALLLKPPS